MEKRDLVKFNKQDVDIINSEIELSEVRGGGIWSDIKKFIEELFTEEEGNTNCVCPGDQQL